MELGKIKNLKAGNLLKLKFISSFLVFVKRFWFFYTLLLVFALGTYLVFHFFYDYRWSEARKQEYLAQKQQEVLFKESEFRSFVEENNKRKERFSKNFSGFPDFFR